MSENSPQSVDEIMNEYTAEFWVVRLSSSDHNESEHRLFEDWLALDPENPKKFAHAQSVYFSSGDLKEDDLLMAELRRARKSSAIVRRPPMVHAWLGAIAAALVLAIALPMMLMQSPALTESQFATAVGEIQSFALDDGTRVHLDTDSKIVTRFSGEARSIQIIQGRAKFDVARDSRPLKVSVGELVVRDIGTVFQVQWDSARIKVGLLEGVVVVEGMGRFKPPITLKPGEVLTRDEMGKVHVGLDSSDQLSLWTEGVAVANRQRLDDFLSDFNRYSKRKVRLANPADGALLVSGRYRTDDQVAMLKAIEQGWGLHADGTGDQEIVLRR